MTWLAVFVGAGLGGMLRYALSVYNARHDWMALGTLSANVLGGFVMGLLLVKAKSWSPEVQVLVLSGMLGGLTTFSTFSAEVLGLAMSGRSLQALAWIALQLGLTLGATFMGLMLARLWW